MIEGSCHCGQVHWRYGPEPKGATACNCSVCRRYGALWIYGFHGEGELAAVNQDDAGGVSRRLQRRLYDDPATHAVAGQDGRGQGLGAHDLGHVGTIALDRAIRGRSRAVPVPAQIDGNGLVARRQMRHLRLPVGVRTAEAVHEYHRRPALARDDVMNERHVRPPGSIRGIFTEGDA